MSTVMNQPEKVHAGLAGGRSGIRPMALGAVLLVAIVGWIFREPVRARLSKGPTLHNSAPPASDLEELIASAPSKTAAIVEAWNTGRIVHREVAIRQIAQSQSKTAPLPTELEAILLAGTLDPDLNVREAAFSGLMIWSHAAVPALALRQLTDKDPDIRRLGLEFLRRSNDSLVANSVIPLLDDAQPDIAALALHTLGRWAGRNFGVKLSDAVAILNDQTGLKEFKPESFAKVRVAAVEAKAWWQANGPTNTLPLPAVSGPTSNPIRRIAAGDFDLAALDGKRFRLSSLRGKVVLINFWTTWCTACVGELPALIELRRRHGSELVILGISLDNLADSHGHVGGHETPPGEGSDAHDGDDHHHEDHAPALKDIRRKVEATAKRRGINYPVLIDAYNEVGGRFNGGELPTTVIIDKEGFVRRRFVGPRSVAVFEGMVAEAAQPVALLAPSPR